MNSHFEQQLKNDAKAIQAQAEARLATTDFSQQIEAQLQQPPKQTGQRSWWFATAAAVSLAVLLLLDNSQPPAKQAPILVAEEPLELKLEQYPIAIEQTINQPLQEEQQAIIEDLKMLRDQLLSI